MWYISFAYKCYSCLFNSIFKYTYFIESNNGSSGSKEDKDNEGDEGNNIKDVIKEAKAAARVSFFYFVTNGQLDENISNVRISLVA